MTATVWRQRLRLTGRSETDLARHLGKSKSALSRIMTGERANLRQREVEEIETALAELEGRPTRPSGLVPLLGYVAAGSPDRLAWALDNPLDWVEAPPMRENNVEVVAIRVAGDSMEPRLFSGETVYVGLNIPPARGGDAVIELADNTALVKSYLGSRDGVIFARQYNPEKELRFSAIQVRGLHAVLWRR